MARPYRAYLLSGTGSDLPRKAAEWRFVVCVAAAPAPPSVSTPGQNAVAAQATPQCPSVFAHGVPTALDAHSDYKGGFLNDTCGQRRMASDGEGSMAGPPCGGHTDASRPLQRHALAPGRRRQHRRFCQRPSLLWLPPHGHRLGVQGLAARGGRRLAEGRFQRLGALRPPADQHRWRRVGDRVGGRGRPEARAVRQADGWPAGQRL